MSKTLDYIADLERENRLLGERCNQLLKDKGELTDTLDQLQEQNSQMFNTIALQEQQIKELEKENANLKSVAEFQQSSNMKRYFEIQELKKENAELKSKNKWYSEQVCYKECAEVWGNLTKAKEILKKFIETSNPIYFEEDRQKVKTQAEQFLKEIEK